MQLSRGGGDCDPNENAWGRRLGSPETATAAAQKRKKPQSAIALRLFRNENRKLKLDALGLFQWRWHLQTSLRERLDQGVFHCFGRGIPGGSEFTDEEELGSLEHFLFSEGERLCPAQGNQTFENRGYFDQRAGPHPFRIFLESVLPIVM